MRGTFIVLGKVATFGAAILVVRALSKAEAGNFFFFLSAASVLGLVLSLGLGQGVSRLTASLDGRGESAAAGQALRSGLLVSAGVALLVVSIMGAISILGPNPTLGLLLAAVVGGSALSLQNVAGGFLRARGPAVQAEVSQGLVPILFVAAAAALFALGHSSGVIAIWTRVALDIAATIALIGFAIRHASGRRGNLRTSTLLAFALPLWVSGLAWLALSQSDVLMLGVLRGSRDVGFYAPLLRVADVAILPFAVLGPYVLPSAARLHAQGALTQIQRLYSTTTRLTLVIASPVVAGLLLGPDQLTQLLFGMRDPRTAIVARVLAGAYLINAALGLNGLVLQGIGRVKPLMARAVAALAVTLVVNALVIPPLGPVGAAIGTLTGFTVLNAANSTLLYTHARITPFKRESILTLLALVTTMGVLWPTGLANQTEVGLVASMALVGTVTTLAAWKTTDKGWRRSVMKTFRHGRRKPRMRSG